jgi:nitroreductase
MIGLYARVSPPPLAILISTDLAPPESPGLQVQGSAAAAQNLLLAAHALGLGAVWTAVYPDADRMLGFANLFSLPGTVIPFALVTVGHPAARPPPVDRYSEDRVHYNGW